MHRTIPYHLPRIQFLLFVFISKLCISVLGEREPGRKLGKDPGELGKDPREFTGKPGKTHA